MPDGSGLDNPISRCLSLLKPAFVVTKKFRARSLALLFEDL